MHKKNRDKLNAQKKYLQKKIIRKFFKIMNCVQIIYFNCYFNIF